MSRADPIAPELPVAAVGAHCLEWLHSRTLVDYERAMRFMEWRVEAIIAGMAPEAIWLLEHPPIYTCGTSARDDELLDRRASPSTGPAAAAASPITGRGSGLAT